ncbi:hypothetical protein ANO11243_011050 [Dothideomycetidae sp. 11243]|nr:hypothetical protein ANO11243_011050 [fungal sp. No.11243]
MPVYRSAGITVSIATLDLDSSVSTTTSLSREGGRRELQRIESELEGSISCLLEAPICSEDDLSPLRFLGNSGDAPYFLVEVINRDAQGPIQEGSTPRPSSQSFIKSSLKAAMALLVKVDLTKCTALRASSGSRDRDVKIEIFFNGELAACRFLASNRNTDGWSSTHAVQTFGGKRLAKQFEVPWVLAADDSIARFDNAQHHRRLDTVWKTVGKSLLDEVNHRGMNKYGDLSPVGDYLASLANSAAPMRKSGQINTHSLLPGIIDVVICLGKGRKDPPVSGHHATPTRLRDKRFLALSRTPALPGNLRGSAISNESTTLPARQTTSKDASQKRSRFTDIGLRPSSGSTIRVASTDTGIKSSGSQKLPVLPSIADVLADTGHQAAILSEQGPVLPSIPHASRDTGHQASILSKIVPSHIISNPPSPLSYSHILPLTQLGALQGDSQQLRAATVESHSASSTTERLSEASIPARIEDASAIPHPPSTRRPSLIWTTPASALSRNGIVLHPKRVPPLLESSHLVETKSKGHGPASKDGAISLQRILNPNDSDGPALSIHDGSSRTIPKASPASTTAPVPGSDTKICTPSRLYKMVIAPDRPRKDSGQTDAAPKDFWSFFRSATRTTSPSIKSHHGQDVVADPVGRSLQTSRRDLTLGVDDVDSASESGDTWQTSALCRNSVFTYAEPEMLKQPYKESSGKGIKQQDVMDGKVVRQVRKERPGEFEEESILCGVRFIML